MNLIKKLISTKVKAYRHNYGFHKCDESKHGNKFYQSDSFHQLNENNHCDDSDQNYQIKKVDKL